MSMKTALPLLLGVIAGLFAFADLYIDAKAHPGAFSEGYRYIFEHFRDFAQILAAMAFILGAINLFQVNAPKIRRRDEDWQYKLVMFVSALVMGLAGVSWHSFGSQAKGDSGSVSVSTDGSAGEGAQISIRTAHKEAIVQIDGGDFARAWHSGQPGELFQPPGAIPLAVQVAPGKHTVSVKLPQSGYSEYLAEVEVGAGQTATVRSALVMYWGARSPEEGRVFNWIYDHVFFPCNATMFALLAFFIASAAFRAFRMRNVESGLLLGAAILVMLGLVPIGRAMSPLFPEIQEWIVDIPNNAGRRAIMMGAALGAIATGLRVILGLERSHLGSE